MHSKHSSSVVPHRKTARIAGLLYLILAITGSFGIMYIPSKFFAKGDATTIANNIMTNEMLFRIGIVVNLISIIIFIFLVLKLNRLLKKVNENHALLMVTLVVVSVPISFLIILNEVAALILLSDADFLKVFEPDQLNALMMLFLDLYKHGIFIVEIFWGLWLFPFGLLVYKSGYIPRIFGILLIFGGFGYVIASFTYLLFPSYGPIVSPIVTIPSAVGEFSIILWLLIKGVKNQRTH